MIVNLLKIVTMNNIFLLFQIGSNEMGSRSGLEISVINTFRRVPDYLIVNERNDITILPDIF